MKRKILVMGLPSAGKTTMSKVLAPRLNAVHFNADEVRANVNKDLGFSEGDRIEHARRMGWLCDQVVQVGGYAIADFICPTPAARAAFSTGGEPFVIWIDRIKQGPFADTNRIFVPPERCDLRVTAEGTPEYWGEKAITQLRPVFDPKKPTALFVGRYQPFHEGHKALITEGINRVGQACIAIRNTHGTDEKNPFEFEYARAGLSMGCANTKVVLSWCRYPTSHRSSTDVTWATRSSASIWTPRSKTFRRPTRAAENVERVLILRSSLHRLLGTELANTLPVHVADVLAEIEKVPSHEGDDNMSKASVCSGSAPTVSILHMTYLNGVAGVP